MIQAEIIVVKDLPKKEIKDWQDKVIYSIARKTLDFTDTKKHFPYLTGDLNRASMAAGVIPIGYAEYGLGVDTQYSVGTGGTVNYAKYVWKMGEGTHWTNDNTIPQWYVGVYEKYRDVILQEAIKEANNEVK